MIATSAELKDIYDDRFVRISSARWDAMFRRMLRALGADVELQRVTDATPMVVTFVDVMSGVVTVAMGPGAPE
jgi:hypothetical protein